ncbi:SRPBCC family protein [Catenulispora subtropica]|uniref:SRPBCC family protein n=1 Tax=Catenulispora subtropica TaxID=450798 RepID=A0ABP5DS20_9ACTN
MNARRGIGAGAGFAGLAGLAALAAVAVAYPLAWRERCLTWGARPEEAALEMPGDDLLPAAPVVSTRAVGVAAPASAIWPWLVQMGPGRAGAYTYDWVENLFGLNMHSADEILPELQDLAVGDVIALGDKLRMRVEILEPERAMVLFSDDGAWVWSFGLYPEGPAMTRLVSRNRIQDPRTGLVTRALSMYLMEPGSLVMERKMLLGVKERAERLYRRDEGAEHIAQSAAATAPTAPAAR